MKTINMGDKVELTALQLVYLLDDAMETLCLRAEDGQEVDTMVIAKEKVLELFERTKVRGSDGREELEPYVVRLAIPDGVEEWHVEPRNNNLALVAVFGHGHPNAKAAAEAERDRLNAEDRKEQTNGNK